MLPRLFRQVNRGDAMDRRQRRRKPKLERRNAIKYIDNDPSPSLDSSLQTRSLDSYTAQTSFRVEGIDGELDRICRNLGLSGPDDLAISAAAWEARKANSSGGMFPRSRIREQEHVIDEPSPAISCPDDSNSAFSDDALSRLRGVPSAHENGAVSSDDPGFGRNSAVDPPQERQFRPENTELAGGIKGIRPPVLAPPPAMSLPVLDKLFSTWDIVRSFAPEEDRGNERFGLEDKGFVSSEDEDRDGNTGDGDGKEEYGRAETDVNGSCSFSTSNDDDSSSTTTEVMFVISPHGRFKRNIKSWIRGGILGSGSFGTVYEGISDDGFFFAVKEVSLLDQGSRAQQCIHQLEQEIALLSQFEHENIVQYFGTDKEEAKLYIFLELVTQGSLASLYQKYHLRDSQVCAYTRQILNGLKYLHDRNVMHRDIKCANTLVDASGSVKLADFGLAKETSKLNSLKSCKGSAYWMAPEVVNPRKTYCLAADIWSLGCTVLEMLTRQVPYANLEWTQALFKIGQGVPPPIPNSLSKDARDFIHQCLQVEPENRPSASELLEHPFVKRPLPASAPSANNNERRL